MKNIQLLKEYRRKIVFYQAIEKIAIVYISIAIFFLIYVYSQNVNENTLLTNKANNFVSVIEKSEEFDRFDSAEEDFGGYFERSFPNTYIISSDGKIISDFDGEKSFIGIEEDIIVTNANYKYYHTTADGGDTFYDIYVQKEIESKNIIPLLIAILLVSPFIIFFVYIFTKFSFGKFGKPVEEIVSGLENFASNVNHEFKTSLSEIISSLELSILTGEYKDAIKSSIDSSKRLDTMLDSLSSIIHFTNLDYMKKRTNIIEELDNSIGDFRQHIHSKNIHIKKNYNPDTSIFKKIHAEPLVLCFTNILKNAIKYSKKGGDIIITIEEHSFAITDFGIGIDKENQKKIFTRFFRESYAESGHGIGLSIVKKICTTYAWKIQVDSEKGKYTTMTIYF